MTIEQITANLNLLKSKYENADPEERVKIQSKINYLMNELREINEVVKDYRQ